MSREMKRAAEGCWSCGRNPQHQQCPQKRAAVDTGHLFRLSPSGCAPPAQTIVLLQTDLAGHVLMGAEARSKRGVFLFGARLLRNTDLPIQHLSPSLLLSCAQGNGLSLLLFKKLVHFVFYEYKDS
ncbi:hypothetical protein DV515_00006305 [Chloebia gouldiae]|uniref:Uncharacterized protein n=1 Tax=Chloebia gouldiae TaxID=44316 RepID=A0A3L8SKW5_CHLGU|nr:hypothetical protein DV515_00006305 [Chloebia gouldiae]